MSRIGRKPIAISSGVRIETKDGLIEVTGPRGKLAKRIPQGIKTRIEGSQLYVERESDEKKFRALHGLVRSLIASMVVGVTEGFSKSLDIVGVGYRAELLGKNAIKFNLGYSNPIEFHLPQGVSAVVEERGTKVVIQGIDKEIVGNISAKIRGLRPPDSYKGKGIRYSGEMPKLKPGKAGIKK